MMVHLDIGVADLAAGMRWALAQGARRAEHQFQDGVCVMLDPEGRPFCLFTDDILDGPVVIAAWEAEQGAFTDAELATVRARLGE